jgi:hypothetical protein
MLNNFQTNFMSKLGSGVLGGSLKMDPGSLMSSIGGKIPGLGDVAGKLGGMADVGSLTSKIGGLAGGLPGMGNISGVLSGIAGGKIPGVPDIGSIVSKLGGMGPNFDLGSALGGLSKLGNVGNMVGKFGGIGNIASNLGGAGGIGNAVKGVSSKVSGVVGSGVTGKIGSVGDIASKFGGAGGVISNIGGLGSVGQSVQSAASSLSNVKSGLGGAVGGVQGIVGKLAGGNITQGFDLNNPISLVNNVFTDSRIGQLRGFISNNPLQQASKLVPGGIANGLKGVLGKASSFGLNGNGGFSLSGALGNVKNAVLGGIMSKFTKQLGILNHMFTGQEPKPTNYITGNNTATAFDGTKYNLDVSKNVTRKDPPNFILANHN